MKASLVFLVLVIIFLCWKFVLSPDKLEFTDRAKVLQGLSLAADYKDAVRDYWRVNEAFPGSDEWDENKIQVDVSRSIVGTITVGEDGPGVVSVHYVAKPDHEVPEGVAGARIMLVPEAFGDKLHWHCRGTVPEKYLPRTCTAIDNIKNPESNNTP